MGDEPDSDHPRTHLQSFIDNHGYLSFLDMEVLDLEQGELRLQVPFHRKLTNDGTASGSIHGGIAATLIDTAGAMCVRSSLEDPRQSTVATIDLNVSYLRPASGGLVATARRVRVGGTVGVARVTVESQTPEETMAEVAEGRGSYRIFRPREPTPPRNREL